MFKLSQDHQSSGCPTSRTPLMHSVAFFVNESSASHPSTAEIKLDLRLALPATRWQVLLFVVCVHCSALCTDHRPSSDGLRQRIALFTTSPFLQSGGIPVMQELGIGTYHPYALMSTKAVYSPLQPMFLVEVSERQWCMASIVSIANRLWPIFSTLR